MHAHSRFPDHRRQTIRNRLLAGAPVLANDLAVEFAVSEDAIRRDLRALAQEGICERVYGGALPLSPVSAPLVERLGIEAAQKARLAAAALALLRGGDCVFLDVSSTHVELARLIPEDCGIRIVTNSVLVAAELIGKPGLECSILGGRVNAHVGGAVDADALAALAGYRIDLCFLGACACDPAEGLFGFDPEDVAFKRALLRAARTSAVLLTNDKLAARAPYRICPIEDITCYVLSADAPAPARTRLAELGCSVLTAAPSA